MSSPASTSPKSSFTFSPTSFPHASIASTNVRPRTNLPPPPPPDRIPPPKGRSHQQKFKTLRKGKDKDKRQPTDLEDDWTIEDVTVNNGSVEQEPQYLDDVQPEENELKPEPRLVEMANREEKKEKTFKSRELVKKTSRLFGRDKDKDRDKSEEPAGSSSSTLAAMRQSSSTSTDSTTSRSITSAFTRQNSIQSRRSPRTSFGQAHSRRASQDSQMSWPTPRSIRSSMTSHDPSNDPQNSANNTGVPIPQRQGASMSSLSRYSLPQPNGNASRSPDTFPNKMSTWFSHLLPVSSESPPSSNYETSSSVRKQPSVAASLFNAARQKAVDGVRHLLDSEAQPDKCMDTIWVRGVAHPGWRPITPENGTSNLPTLEPGGGGGVEDKRASLSMNRPSPTSLRPSSWKRNTALPPTAQPQPSTQQHTQASNQTTSPSKGFTGIWNSSTLSLGMPIGGSPNKERESGSGAESPSKKKNKEIVKWPEQFYDDFKSTVWCTYRSQYAPISSLSPNLLIPSPEAYYASFGPPLDATSPSSPRVTIPTAAAQQTASGSGGWGWSKEERGLTSDAGWGCRDWRVPSTPASFPEATTNQEIAALKDYAKYAQMLSWFLDDPSPLCPFSVHRMALIGKELGKEVGEWFGPSTAAGALKTLANSFAPCGVAVATATDSIIYKSDVYTASNLPSDDWNSISPTFNSSKKKRGGDNEAKEGKWGKRAVLILVGIRLGLDGVNPIYYDSIKALFTFPQSVGIAGGRPSSSYYFVGSQANHLFYLDPHLTRPAIPLQVPPLPVHSAKEEGSMENSSILSTTEEESEEGVMICTPETPRSTTPSTFSAPEQIEDEGQEEWGQGSKYKLDVVDADGAKVEEIDDGKGRNEGETIKEEIPKNAFESKGVVQDQSEKQRGSASTASVDSQVDPQMLWYTTAYPDSLLRTYHCEKIKKMPLSGLDPSMLLGFVCKDEDDFEDFVDRVAQLPKKIFTVQDEMPSWEEDDDAGLESVSEPDFEGDEFEEPGTAKPRFDSSSPVNEDSLKGPRVVSASTTATPLAAKEGHLDVEETNSTDDDDESIGTTTAVRPVDIARHLHRVDLSSKREQEGDDDDGEWVGGTPSSQGVLVEPPSLKGTPSKSRSSALEPRHEQNGEKKQERHVFPARNRMESWVEPVCEGKEAPNGDNLL
ncbi:cysteine protease ATG4 [Cryptococcus neoformans]|nr:cysteine protease ATG4 [Cryptococcus neoformans]